MQTVSGEETSPVLPERAREVGDARVDELGEDVRLVAGRAQLALDRERLVADRVAVARAPRAAGGPSPRRLAPPAPSPSGRRVRHHALERLLPPRERLDAARRAAGCGSCSSCTSRFEAASARARGCGAGGREKRLRSDWRESAAIIGVGFQNSFCTGRSSRRARLERRGRRARGSSGRSSRGRRRSSTARRARGTRSRRSARRRRAPCSTPSSGRSAM